MVTAREVHTLLEERSELEPAVDAVLGAEEPFTFDDLAVDSGAFGEIVSSGIVEEVDEGYRVADRDAVTAGLAGDIEREEASGREWSLPRSDRRVAGALAGALLLVVLFRTAFSIGPVFQEGTVVLSANDPYYYRYWVEQLLATPDMTLSTLPGAVAKGEPLYVATMWLVASVLGGGGTAAGQVLAWYPVVSALLSGILVYLLTKRVTDDTRVALAAVIFLAIIPGHAMRTSLGFADHHAFDYPWLGVTALSLVVLAGSRFRSGRGLLGAAGVAVGVTGQVLAWEAGPLLIVPVGLATATTAVVVVHHERSPLAAGAPTLAGLAVAAGATWAAHRTLGWQTDVVAIAPALLFGGSLGVFAVAEVVSRITPSARASAAAVVGTGVASTVWVAVAFPGAWATLTARARSTLVDGGAAAETHGLFAGSAGWLLLFGFVLVLAVPYLAWGTSRILTDDRWVPLISYAWWFFLLSVIQVRFVGEFATFAAVFAGLGFVHLSERVGVARPPRPFDYDVDGRTFSLPDRRRAGVLVLLFLLVGGLGLLQVPIKTSQVSTPAERYETARWMENYSDTSELGDTPEYVFSSWSHNRMFNYFVNGDSRSHWYATTYYQQFLGSTNASEWYERLRGRTEFVVYTGTDGPPGSIAERLNAYGSRTANTSGLKHYRAIYVSEDGTYRVFTLVPGAKITGTAKANTTITVETAFRVRGVVINYERQVIADADGGYALKVAYPGTYNIGEKKIRVPEAAVQNGTEIVA